MKQKGIVMEQELVDILSTLPTFRDIPPRQIPYLLHCSGSLFRQYKKGEIILIEEDSIRLAGLVVKGRVNMLIENLHGAPFLMVKLQPGEFFGESYACGNNKFARMSVKAESACTVLMIPFEKIFYECSSDCPFHRTMVLNMATMLADKNVRLMERMQLLSQRTTRDKVMEYLTLEQQHQEKRAGKAVAPGEWFPVDHNRTEMAEYLSVDRAALARELTNMKNEGIIDFDRNHFRFG